MFCHVTFLTSISVQLSSEVCMQCNFCIQFSSVNFSKSVEIVYAVAIELIIMFYEFQYCMLNVFVCCDIRHHGMSPHLRGVMDLDCSSQAAVDSPNCYLLDVCVEFILLTFTADYFIVH